VNPVIDGCFRAHTTPPDPASGEVAWKGPTGFQSAGEGASPPAHDSRETQEDAAPRSVTPEPVGFETKVYGMTQVDASEQQESGKLSRGKAANIPVGFALLKTILDDENVWLGEREADGTPVAIRFLSTETSSDPALIESIQKHLDSIARTEHPGVSSVIEHGMTPAKRFFYAMRLDRSRTLADFITEGNTSPELSLEIIRSLAETLAPLHEHGQIHGRLSPYSIGIDESLDPIRTRIFDFTPPAAFSRINIRSRELEYLSPERRMSHRNLDARADVFSLGAVFYVLLTGRLPIGRFREPSKHTLGVTGKIDELVLGMLDPDINQRTASMGVVLRVLAESIQVFEIDRKSASPNNRSGDLSLLEEREPSVSNLTQSASNEEPVSEMYVESDAGSQNLLHSEPPAVDVPSSPQEGHQVENCAQTTSIERVSKRSNFMTPHARLLAPLLLLTICAALILTDQGHGTQTYGSRLRACVSSWISR